MMLTHLELKRFLAGSTPLYGKYRFQLLTVIGSSGLPRTPSRWQTSFTTMA